MNYTFKQFLNEMAVVGSDEKNKMEEIAKLVKRDCQAFLHATQPGSFLYRGIDKNFNASLGNMYRFKVPAERFPQDSPQWIHELWNEIIEEKLGIQGARSRAVFASNGQKQAAQYAGNSGSVYAIFPIGPYHLLWDEDVHDSFMHVKTVWMKIVKQHENVPPVPLSGAADSLDPDTFAYLRQELKDALSNHYEMSGTPFGPKEHEVYVMTNEYYAINIGRSGGKVDREQEAFLKGLTTTLWS